MTINKLFEDIDALKPNAFDNEAKCIWLNDVEATVQTRLHGVSSAAVIKYDYASDTETDLLVLDAFSKLYRYYIFAIMDFANAEYDRYANDMALYNAAFYEYAEWYCQTYNTSGRN